MAITSQTRWCQLDGSTRLDAEYYQPANLSLLSRLEKHAPRAINEFADVTDGIHASPDDVQDGGILYLSAKCVRENALDLSNTLRISDAQHDSNLRSALQPGDVLITTVGTIGNCAVVLPDFLPANIDRHVGIIRVRRRADVDPWFLSTFMNSKYGRFQSVREATGNVQLNLFIFKIKQLLVARLECEAIAADMAKQANSALDAADETYENAKAELLERLAWTESMDVAQEETFTENFSALTRTNRWDPEHFTPRSQRMRAHLTNKGALSVGDFCPKPHRGVQPVFIEGGDTWVIDSKAVRSEELRLGVGQKTNRSALQVTEYEKAKVITGDVLLNSTGRGTLGRAGCYLTNEPAIADNHVAIIRPDSGVCSPLYLSLFLNSPPGLQQSEMFQTGSSGQLELYPSHIEQFLVFLPRNKSGRIDIEWQRQLGQRLLTAQQARVSAATKFEQAKRLIEREIEQ